MGVGVLHRDILGSVRLITDETGAVRGQYAFAAYGEQTLGALDETSAIRFAGQYYVPELDLYYMRARFYDPGAGRFLTPDLLPTEPEQPQSFNPYLYVGANPVRFIDPTGMISLISVSVSFAVASILITSLLSFMPSPVVWLANQFGFDVQRLKMDMVGWSLAVAGNFGPWLVGGLQFDYYRGQTKQLYVLSLFVGGQVGVVYGDPRLGSKMTMWTGPILGSPGGDPGTPRPGALFITFSGTFAQMLTRRVGQHHRNTFITPEWVRAAGAVQWELGHIRTQGVGLDGFLASVTMYGSYWGTTAAAEFTRKFGAINRMNQNRSLAHDRAFKRRVWDAGIAMTFYLPLLWAQTSSQGMQINGIDLY
ncbi:MAG: RHS repeat-associated core domain-containing protein [Caldilineaceae bacterium]|nr:RHS repeat-associated core domain-containing protein [Caldilineaceae bacterium]